VPYTAVSPQHPTASGVPITYGAVTAGAGNGDKVRPHSILIVRNASTAAITVTLITGGTVDGLAIADTTVTVAAGADVMIGPFAQHFVQPSGPDAGQVYVEYSSATSVTRACIAPAT
jgi:hypothetical protein